MRVIAGAGKGMEIQAPKGILTRPTSAKVREAVMSSMASFIEGQNFLDLFAGSGSMGLEAISRGVDKCIFVDSHKHVVKVLNGNLSEMKRRFEKQNLNWIEVAVLNQDLNTPCKDILNFQADFVWADPPYEQCVTWFKNYAPALLQGVLKKGGIFAFESKWDDRHELVMNNEDSEWKRLKEKKYGDTSVIIWEKM